MDGGQLLQGRVLERGGGGQLLEGRGLSEGVGRAVVTWEGIVRRWRVVSCYRGGYYQRVEGGQLQRRVLEDG